MSTIRNGVRKRKTSRRLYQLWIIPYLVAVEKLVVVGVETLDDVDTDDDVEIELDVDTLERKQKRITTSIDITLWFFHLKRKLINKAK